MLVNVLLNKQLTNICYNAGLKQNTEVHKQALLKSVL